MPRKKYKIDKITAKTAQEWIEGQFRKGWYCWPGTTQEDHDKAREAFDGVDTKDHAALNNWAEAFMDRKQWETLKTYIRADRKRKKDRKEGRRTKSLDVSLEAYYMLKDIAEYEKITLSQAMETHLKKRWNEVLDATEDEEEI